MQPVLRVQDSDVSIGDAPTGPNILTRGILEQRKVSASGHERHRARTVLTDVVYSENLNVDLGMERLQLALDRL